MTPASATEREETPSPRGSRRRLPWLLGAVGTVLVLGAGVGAVVLRGEGRPEHQTAGSTVDSHEVPGSVTGEAWEWEPPQEEGGGITDVHPLPFGLAAELDDGVVALDAATGEQVWHYRRPDATVVSASATPDGELFALAFQPEGREGEELETGEEDGTGTWDLVVLDAVTGEIATEYGIDPERRLGFDLQPVVGPPGSDFDAPATGVHHLTDDARLVHAIGPARVEARALDDGEVLWSNTEAFDGPVQSDVDGRIYLGQVQVAGGTVLASQLYATNDDPRFHHYDLTAIDSASGEVRWRKSWELGDIRGLDDPTFSAPSPEGGVAVWLPTEDPGVLLDLHTGEELGDGLWEHGQMVGLLSDGYVTVDGMVHTYRDRDGAAVDEMEMQTREGEGSLAASIATPEAVIGLYPGASTGGGGAGEAGGQVSEATVRVFARDGGEKTASIPLELGFDPQAGEVAARLRDRVAEPPRFLRAVPGAVVVLDQRLGEGGELEARRIIGLR